MYRGYVRSGEKGNRCESCTNSSLYLGNACRYSLGDREEGNAWGSISQETCPSVVRKAEAFTPRVTGCTDDRISGRKCQVQRFHFTDGDAFFFMGKQTALSGNRFRSTEDGVRKKKGM